MFMLLTRWRNVRLFYTTFVVTMQKRSQFESGHPVHYFVATSLFLVVSFKNSFLSRSNRGVLGDMQSNPENHNWLCHAAAIIIIEVWSCYTFHNALPITVDGGEKQMLEFDSNLLGRHPNLF